MSFVSTEEVTAMWAFVDPIINAWQSGQVELTEYEPGTLPVWADDQSS